MPYNPIIIPSKHIYGEPTYNTSNNIINGVEYNNNEFNDKIQIYSLNVDFNYDEAGVFQSTYFIENSGFNNISFTEEPFAGISNTTAYYVNFTTIIELNDGFLLEDLTVNVFSNESNSLDKNKATTMLWQVYNPKSTSYFTFDIVQSVDGFNDMPQGIWGKCGLERIGTKTFKMHLKMLYMAKSGSELANICFNRKINLFAKNLTSNKKIVGNNAIKVFETNELISSVTGITKIEYNAIKLYGSIGSWYAYSSKPVESTITIKAYNPYSSSTVPAGELTFTINQGESKSNTISGIYLFSYLTIKSILPEYDSVYAYDYYAQFYEENITQIGKIICDDIIENYKNGKKRINIKVGYGDYYYADGTPYGGTSGKKKLLQVGDIVQPMKWKNNKDVPFAVKKDGSPMIFEITSAEIDTNGAPKLFLSLLEKIT